MALSMNSIAVGLRFGSFPKTKVAVSRKFIARSSTGLRIRAVEENGGSRRLVDIIRIVPELSRNYFRSPSRRALFGGISLLGGFYVAQTISLSFGALGVNDVIAAVVCVLLTEYVTKFYYSRPKLIIDKWKFPGVLLFLQLCKYNRVPTNLIQLRILSQGPESYIGSLKTDCRAHMMI